MPRFPFITSESVTSKHGFKTRTYNMRGIAHSADTYELEINGQQIYLQRDGAEKLRKMLGDLMNPPAEEAEKPAAAPRGGARAGGKKAPGNKGAAAEAGAEENPEGEGEAPEPAGAEDETQE